MAYQHSDLDSMLASALGDDPMLIRDLRQAFLDSAREHLSALTQAATTAEWHNCAWRFKGLCATFGAEELAVLAATATEVPKGDPAILRKLHVALAALAAAD